MSTTYSSGRPRVHASGPEAEIRAAILEYEEFSRWADGDNARLAASLLETAADLREELEIRKTETWRERP